MRAPRTTVRKMIYGLLATFALLAVPASAQIVWAENPVASVQAETAASTTSPTVPPADPVTPASPAVRSDGDQAAATTAPAVKAAPSDEPSSAAKGTDTTTVPSVQATTNLTSQASSGDAAVSGNHTAGNAASGSATASATVLNVANADGSSAGTFQTFNCDITQDLQQNIVVDPSTLMPLPYCDSGNLSGASDQAPARNDARLQSGSSLATILNSIVLSAASGTATVSGNRTGGDASSGNATALANVVNLANTTISSRNSFIGVINIYGSLKGNILVPQSFVDSLAAGTTAGGRSAGDTTIKNSIDLSAASGMAAVTDNRNGGDASSGEAMTGLTVLNLTGQQVVASNSLLVFVNVLGKWMGMIVPAAGSTNTAMLNGGLQAGAAMTSGVVSPAGDLPAQAGQVQDRQAGNSTITNSVSLNARSGDAAVTDNRNGGNATSGGAKAGANLLNITNSDFWLQDWFGALFINVLGSWAGDFDIQNSAVPAADGGNQSQPVRDVQVFRFETPTTVTPAVATSRPATAAAVTTAMPASGNNTAAAPTGMVLEASDTAKPSTGTVNRTDKTSGTNWLLATGLILSLVTVVGTVIGRRL